MPKLLDLILLQTKNDLASDRNQLTAMVNSLTEILE